MIACSAQEAAANEVRSSALVQTSTQNVTTDLQNEVGLCACSSSTCTTYAKCETAAAIETLFDDNFYDDYATRTLSAVYQSFHEMYNLTYIYRQVERFLYVIMFKCVYTFPFGLTFVDL